MRPARLKAPIIEPWVSPVQPRVTLDENVPPVDGKPGEAHKVARLDSESEMTPFDETEVVLREPVMAASVAASEAPPPRSEAPRSRPISSDVLRLTRVAKYELIGRIGQGSFGVVYTARDTELDREVALKVLNPSHHGDEGALHRFLREARAAARIAHPGIVTVHDCGRFVPEQGDELAYIAMERLGGESLTRRLERVGSLTPEAAAEIARQLASALDAAHQADVLHRDLKPDNVFLVPDPAVPSGERAKVLDFGLAKIGTSRQTGLGAVFGTPRYMSPEQCRSEGPLDARSDLYALGCILFELLAGRAPFEGAIYEVLQRHVYEPAPRVSSLAPGIPPALDALVAAMLEKEPGNRPASMAEVGARLEEMLAELAGAAAAAAVADAGAGAAAGASIGTSIEAPLVLDEADRAELDALALRPPATKAPREERKRGRRPLALLAAIAIIAALAGAIALMAAHRGSGRAAGLGGAAVTAPQAVR